MSMALRSILNIVTESSLSVVDNATTYGMLHNYEAVGNSLGLARGHVPTVKFYDMPPAEIIICGTLR